MIKFDGAVYGFEEADKNLSTLPQRVENKILQKATTKAMREGLQAVKNAAPVDKTGGQSAASKKYGRLKRNIRVKVSKLDRKKGQRGAYITTGRSFWGFFLEMGTRFMAAKPWFAPAFRKTVPKIFQTLGRELGEGIEQEASRGVFGRAKK